MKVLLFKTYSHVVPDAVRHLAQDKHFDTIEERTDKEIINAILKLVNDNVIASEPVTINGCSGIHCHWLCNIGWCVLDIVDVDTSRPWTILPNKEGTDETIVYLQQCSNNYFSPENN